MEQLVEFIKKNNIKEGSVVIETTFYNTHYKILEIKDNQVYVEYEASFGKKQKLIDFVSTWKISN